MLLRAYLPKFITALFGGLFIATGILTFGNAMIFDRLFIGVLIFTAIVCRSNINVVGIIAILALERLLEEFLWFSVIDQFYNIWQMKIVIYAGLAWMLYKLWYDTMVKIVLPFILLSVAAEFYWYFIDYEKIPGIYWYNIIIGLNLLTRYLLFSRMELTESITSKSAESINLDWVVYQITRLYIVIEILNISEYLIRHLLTYSNIQLIYSSYPYLLHSISTFTLWVVFNETNKLIKSRFVSA
ncbi:MAG: hypothetical protein ACI808_000694 [Paraglaciecola sp.]|jgi:hypothetical protein